MKAKNMKIFLTALVMTFILAFASSAMVDIQLEKYNAAAEYNLTINDYSDPENPYTAGTSLTGGELSAAASANNGWPLNPGAQWVSKDMNDDDSTTSPGEGDWEFAPHYDFDAIYTPDETISAAEHPIFIFRYGVTNTSHMDKNSWKTIVKVYLSNGEESTIVTAERTFAQATTRHYELDAKSGSADWLVVDLREFVEGGDLTGLTVEKVVITPFGGERAMTGAKDSTGTSITDANQPVFYNAEATTPYVRTFYLRGLMFASEAEYEKKICADLTVDGTTIKGLHTGMLYEYSTTDGAAQSDWTQVAEGSTQITGLKSGTTYYVREYLGADAYASGKNNIRNCVPATPYTTTYDFSKAESNRLFVNFRYDIQNGSINVTNSNFFYGEKTKGGGTLSTEANTGVMYEVWAQSSELLYEFNFKYTVASEDTINVADHPYLVASYGNMFQQESRVVNKKYDAILQGLGQTDTYAKIELKLYEHDTIYTYVIPYGNAVAWKAKAFRVDVTEGYPDINGHLEWIKIYPYAGNFPDQFGTKTDGVNRDLTIADIYDVNGNKLNTTGFIDLTDAFPNSADCSKAQAYIQGFAFFAYGSDAANFANKITKTEGIELTAENSYTSFEKENTSELNKYFTIAAFPSTRLFGADSTLMAGVADWIITHQKDQNIKFVTNIGQITGYLGDGSNDYYQTGSKIDEKLGINAFSGKDYDRSFLFYASLGLIDFGDGEKEEAFEAPGKTNAKILDNFKAALDKIKAAGIPFALTPSGTDDGDMQFRGNNLLSTIFEKGYFTGIIGQFKDRKPSDGNKVKTDGQLEIAIENGWFNEENLFEDNDLSDEIGNTYYTFNEAGVDYIIINLEACPTYMRKNSEGHNTVEWLNDLLASEEYSDHKAIIFTNILLDNSGKLAVCWENDFTTGESQISSVTGATPFFGRPNWVNEYPCVFGDELWRLAIQKHENVMLVVSSNDRRKAAPADAMTDMTTLTGVNGNKVVAIRSDVSEQFGKHANAVNLIRISPEGGVEFAIYSPSMGDWTYTGLEDVVNYKVIGTNINGEGVNEMEAAAGTEVTITPYVDGQATAIVLEYETTGTYYKADGYTEDHTSPRKKVVVSNDGTFTFTMPSANVTVAEVHTKAYETDVNITLAGTGIRLEDDEKGITAGMRFLANVYGEYDSDNIYGILMTTPEVISYNDCGTFYELLEQGVLDDATGEITDKYLRDVILDIKGEKLYSVYEGGFTYTGVIINMPSDKYGTDIVAVAYVGVSNGDGTYTFTYSNIMTRNASEVADAAFYGGRETMAAEATLFENYLS